MRCLLSRCLEGNLRLPQSDRVRRPCEIRPRPEKLARAHVPCFLLLSSHTSCDFFFFFSFFFSFSIHAVASSSPPACRIPSGRTPPGSCSWKRRPTWGWRGSFKSWPNLTRTRYVWNFPLTSICRHRARHAFHAQLIEPPLSVGLQQFNLSAVWFQSVWQVRCKGLSAHPWNRFSC